MNYRLAIALVCCAVFMSSCMGDMAVKFKGRFVDETHQPYDQCIFSVEYRSSVIDQANVSGEFVETVVFRPTSFAPLIVNGSCEGAAEVYAQEVDEIPNDFGVPVDLGDIVLRKAEAR